MKEITPMVACLLIAGKTIKKAEHKESPPLSTKSGGDEMLIEFTDGTSLVVESRPYFEDSSGLVYHLSEGEKK